MEEEGILDAEEGLMESGSPDKHFWSKLDDGYETNNDDDDYERGIAIVTCSQLADICSKMKEINDGYYTKNDDDCERGAGKVFGSQLADISSKKKKTFIKKMIFPVQKLSKQQLSILFFKKKKMIKVRSYLDKKKSASQKKNLF
ncbi:hypothetical protein BVC80_8697g19 [Macleaya cordata]|uniref:Uncharacterized protein n=1 Tax=Macleaya cordata TaxID=56857 RepID=A0A200Q0D5_MACCD|nr:hypothetical protein BVC80_8697g19 [Macleaya cordata]